MAIIGTIEDALLGIAKATLGDTIKQCQSIGGVWTEQSLQRALQFAPGVYVAFIGASKAGLLGYMNLSYSVYCVSKGSDDVNRRRGNPRVIGAYDLVARLSTAFSGAVLVDIGSIELQRIENLFADALFDIGGSVYALQLSIPNVSFATAQDVTGLDDFMTFDGRFSQGDDAPLAHDIVTLEGGAP